MVEIYEKSVTENERLKPHTYKKLFIEGKSKAIFPIHFYMNISLELLFSH